LNIYILGIIAIFTLALNLFLVLHLLKDNNDVYSHEGSKEEIMNFVLSSEVQNETETEILTTEIIASSDNNNE
jgi:hypothetical protein